MDLQSQLPSDKLYYYPIYAVNIFFFIIFLYLVTRPEVVVSKKVNNRIVREKSSRWNALMVIPIGLVLSFVAGSTVYNNALCLSNPNHPRCIPKYYDRRRDRRRDRRPALFNIQL